MANEKIGRNHTCPCGSGLKWKNCCGMPKGQIIQPSKKVNRPTAKPQEVRMLTQQGLMRLLWLLIHDREDSMIMFPMSDIDNLSSNCMLNFNYDKNTDVFTVTALEKPMIVTPFVPPPETPEIET